jgi:hypothetical protein
MPKMCAFCPQDAVEKGGEHIWDDWLNKEQPPGTMFNARKRLSVDGPVIEYESPKFNEKLAVVCTSCNNGWMGDLTAKMKLAFERPSLHGEPFTLSLRDAALLAAFSFMKAVVSDHAIDAVGHGPFFSRGARERFRVSLEVPPVVKIWLFAFQGEARMSTKNNFSVIDVPSDDPRFPLIGHEFCSHTYVVGKLGLQLLGVRWKDIRNSGRPLYSLKPNGFWDSATTQFWPYRGTVSWPPPKYFGDDAIQEFIYRFKLPVNVRMGRIGNDWYVVE